MMYRLDYSTIYSIFESHTSIPIKQTTIRNTIDAWLECLLMPNDRLALINLALYLITYHNVSKEEAFILTTALTSMLSTHIQIPTNRLAYVEFGRMLHVDQVNIFISIVPKKRDVGQLLFIEGERQHSGEEVLFDLMYMYMANAVPFYLADLMVRCGGYEGLQYSWAGYWEGI